MNTEIDRIPSEGCEIEVLILESTRKEEKQEVGKNRKVRKPS